MVPVHRKLCLPHRHRRRPWRAKISWMVLEITHRNYPMLYCASRTLAIIYRLCLAPRGTCVGIVFEFAMSYVFFVDTVITSQDIIIGCDNAGIEIDNITSVQHCASNNLWVVTFDSKAVKDAALNEHSINILAAPFFWEIVKIYELPDELPDSVVIGRLAHYSRVIFLHDHVADTILNGVCTARMFIERPIPAQAFIAGQFACFWYPSQPKTCRKCGAEDHLAAACKLQRCFNCERPGHRAEQCDMAALCCVCLSDSHETSSCPFVYMAAT